ncbi:hypothetical protein FCV25MIE_22222 [Fagus crenata]
MEVDGLNEMGKQGLGKPDDEEVQGLRLKVLGLEKNYCVMDFQGLTGAKEDNCYIQSASSSSRKRRRISDLPEELLKVILTKLPFVDNIRSSAVCSSRNSATTQAPLCAQTP